MEVAQWEGEDRPRKLIVGCATVLPGSVRWGSSSEGPGQGLSTED